MDFIFRKCETFVVVIRQLDNKLVTKTGGFMKSLILTATITLLSFAASDLFAEDFKSHRQISPEMKAEREAFRAEVKAKKDAIKLIENDEERLAAKEALKAELSAHREAKKNERIEAMLADGLSQEEIDEKMQARKERRQKRRSKNRGN